MREFNGSQFGERARDTERNRGVAAKLNDDDNIN